MQQQTVSNTDPILVVDDDISNAQVLKEEIAKWGVSNPVHHLLDGDMVIPYLQIALAGGFGMQPLPALMLLAERMPNVGGVEVLQWMAKNNLNQIRVIGMSSAPGSGTASKMRRFGAVAIISKPAKAEDYEQIKQVLGGSTAGVRS